MTQHCGTIALIGLPNAGKSSLLNALIGQKLAPVTYKPNTTRRIVNGVVTKGDAQFIFVDTPGMTQKGSVPDADLILWVADAKLSPEKPPVRLPKEFSLALNQIDRFKDKREILPVMQAWNDLIQPSMILPVSARTADGLDELLKTLGPKLPERAFLFDPEAITDASERELVAELIREKALLCLQSEVPHQLQVHIESFDESRRDADTSLRGGTADAAIHDGLLRSARNDGRPSAKKSIVDISAVIEVAKESHKPIVIGKGGASLKKIGQLARAELENLLDCQVMLRLFVRVAR